jgi:hypothetical protein
VFYSERGQVNMPTQGLELLAMANRKNMSKFSTNGLDVFDKMALADRCLT